MHSEQAAATLSGQGWRALFPLYLTITMAVLDMASGITSSTVHSLHQFYEQQQAAQNQNTTDTTIPIPSAPTMFQLNLINFIPNFVYVIVALIVPAARLYKSTLLFLCFAMTTLGVVFQSMYSYGYGYLLAGAILQGLPQPLILSNLLLICQDYFPERFQAFAIGAFTSIMSTVSGLASLWCLKQMYTVDGLIRYFQLTCTILVYGYIGLSILFLFVYFTQTPVSEWDTPFVHPAVPTSTLPTSTLSPSTISPSTMSSSTTAKRTPIRFWVYCWIFGWMNAAAGIIDNIFEQMLKEYQLTDTEALVALNLYLTPSILTGIIAGICSDKIKSSTFRLWVLPFSMCMLQTVAQIGLFYMAAHSTVGLYLWILIFSAANGTLPVVFLPTLIKLFPSSDTSTSSAATANKSRLETEGKINQYVLLWCMFCTSLSVLLLWRQPEADVLIFGTLMLAIGIASLLLLFISFLLDRRR